MIGNQITGKIVLYISIIVSMVLSFVFALYVNKMRKKYNVKFNKISGLYMYVVAVIVICVSVLYSMERLKGITHWTLTAVPLVLCIPLIYLKKILGEIIAKENVDLQYEFLVRKRESDEQYFDSMKEYMERLSVVRHDFMNQIQLAYFMMDGNDNASECKKLLDSMSEELQSTRPALYCSNRMINIVLSMCMKKISDKNIKMNIDVIVPGMIKNEEILCSIISNMVEECLDLTSLSEENKERDMDFSMKKKEDRIITRLRMRVDDFMEKEQYQKIRKMYDKYLNYVIEKCGGEVYCDEDNDMLSIIAICQD